MSIPLEKLNLRKNLLQQGYVCKRLNGNCIALLVPSENGKNNFSRLSLRYERQHKTSVKIANKSKCNPECAKYRCEKALVVTIRKIPTGATLEDVYDKFFKYETLLTASSQYDKRFIYRVNNTVFDKMYEDSDNVCTFGIHVFVNLEPAFYYSLNYLNYTGPFREWHDNGHQYKKYYINNGLINGPYIEWYANGYKKEESYYVNSNLNGYRTFWNKNGTIDKIYNFKYGVCCNPYKYN